MKSSLHLLRIPMHLLTRSAILLCFLFLTSVSYSQDDPDGPVADALYQQIFGYAPDANGRAELINMFHLAKTVREAVVYLVHSGQYKEQFVNGRDHTDIVRNLYRRVLAREGDRIKEVAPWVAKLDQGASFDGVANAFIQSQEYSRRFGDNGVPGNPRVHYVFEPLSYPANLGSAASARPSGTPLQHFPKDVPIRRFPKGERDASESAKSGRSPSERVEAELRESEAVPQPRSGAVPESSPTNSNTLPPFFPPRATESADLGSVLNTICDCYKRLYGKGPTMSQLDRDLTWVLLNKKAGYENLSHYWLAGNDNPGFAVATHLELIDDLGEPVLDHRFDYSLPAPYWFSGWAALKAWLLPNNGRYRLIALVVSKKSLKEKEGEMSYNDVDKINHGPTGLADNDWANLEVTTDYHFTAYIYEFYRKTREDQISAAPNSAMRAWAHLNSIHFLDDVDDRMKLEPVP